MIAQCAGGERKGEFRTWSELSSDTSGVESVGNISTILCEGLAGLADCLSDGFFSENKFKIQIKVISALKEKEAWALFLSLPSPSFSSLLLLGMEPRASEC
jgi:hypothetical protein